MDETPTPWPGSTLLALRGLPASGKSTFAINLVAARPEDWFRICRDDLRAMGHNGTYLDARPGQPRSGTERIIRAARDAMLVPLLRDGINVVVDETNLSDRKILHLAALAEQAGARFDMLAFTTSYDVCFERNSRRTGAARVPDEAMERFRVELGDRDLSVMPVMPLMTVSTDDGTG